MRTRLSPKTDRAAQGNRGREVNRLDGTLK